MRSRRPIAFVLAAVLVASCGNDGGSAATVPTQAPSTSGPTTTSTTIAATTTTGAASTTSTIAVTTTSEALPVPAAAPQPRANEPYFELGTIEIPKIGVLKPLLEGVTLTTLDSGPGHWPGTALPGRIGNVVIGGHRTSHDKPFRHIDQLVQGDEVILSTPEGRFVYRVTSTEIVTPDAIRIIDQTPEFTATLFACHPLGSTRERFIVYLKLENT